MSSHPEDPFMLLSWVNTMLRDKYGSFEELCAAEDLPAKEIEEKLKGAGFSYEADLNQFR